MSQQFRPRGKHSDGIVSMLVRGCSNGVSQNTSSCKQLRLFFPLNNSAIFMLFFFNTNYKTFNSFNQSIVTSV